MNRLATLEAESIYLLREAYYHIKPIGVLWSLGKDSNVLLWLIKKAFLGAKPFRVLLLDTGDELEEVYQFRDEYVKKWDLPFINITCPPIEETDEKLPPNARAASRKTMGLKNAIIENDFKGIILGIRKDEQAIRNKENFFSLRDNEGNWNYQTQNSEFWNIYDIEIPKNTHIRIHPLLSWTELDIWEYIKQENIPVVSLYFSKNGKRYRSLGEKQITKPIASEAKNIDEIIEELKNTSTPERAGRLMDQEEEDSFEKLRLSGYM